MTISTTTNRASFAGNGSTTAFATGFKFFANGDLTVILVVNSTGVETTKTITTHYSVTGAGVASGGTVTMGTAPASGETLVIVREQAYTQGVDLVENDPFPSQTVEDVLDKLTIMTQQNDSAITRSLRQHDGDTADIDRLPAKVTRKTKVLGFDSDGDPVASTLTLAAIESGSTAAASSATAAASSATAAASSATASASSATASASSATASASSATAAAASATSIGLTTRGDLLKRGASANERLAIGSANKVLTTNGTDPAWGQVSLTAGVTGTLPLANGGTGATSLSGAGIAVLGANTFTGTQSLADAGSISISTPLLAGADHTFTGLSAQMLAGGAISAFDLVCIHTVTQEVVEADASAYATARVIGIAPAAISDTATGTVLLQGFIRDDTWTWTAGSTLYLSETAGAMTHTAPSTDGAFVLVVGVALSPDVVYINPSMDVIEHA
jgi:hypothetical protein|tara:strand:- start:587 stop:1927 length:1341 start_codon:yes stop_codon:yes gene_type:complete